MLNRFEIYTLHKAVEALRERTAARKGWRHEYEREAALEALKRVMEKLASADIDNEPRWGRVERMALGAALRPEVDRMERLRAKRDLDFQEEHYRCSLADIVDTLWPKVDAAVTDHESGVDDRDHEAS